MGQYFSYRQNIDDLKPICQDIILDSDTVYIIIRISSIKNVDTYSVINLLNSYQPTIIYGVKNIFYIVLNNTIPYKISSYIGGEIISDITTLLVKNHPHIENINISLHKTSLTHAKKIIYEIYGVNKSLGYILDHTT